MMEVMMTENKRALREREEAPSLLGAGLRGLATMSLAAAGGWILYSNLAIDHEMTLPDALPAERKVYQSSAAGPLSYYRSRTETGKPLVLIHSVNAAASAYEMRPLYLQYSSRRPVFALDLPGFGFSSRSKRVYSPALYEAAVLDFLETQVGEPADVVALSLGCEFAARAALLAPERFDSLTLISPTGFSQGGGDRSSQQAGKSGLSQYLQPMFSFPLWARPFYDLLTTRTSINYFLEQSFMGAVPKDLIDYAYVTAHQPGAEHAPLYFISGKLFTPNIKRNVYEQLKVPTLVLYDRDSFTSFERLPDLLAENQSWQAVRLVPTLGMPHFERTEDTVEVLDRFWE
jgi:pimeloyl-ACP methyl ester carboxylesterase